MRNKRLPKFLKKYFWEVDFEKLSLKKHRYYILERILEYGEERAIRWMKKNFKKEEIVDFLLRFRTLSPKSANFWAVVFNVKREKVLCLQRYYLKIQRKHWLY